MKSIREQIGMLLEQCAVQGVGDVGDGNRIVERNVTREIDLNDIVALAQTTRQVAVNVLDRDRIGVGLSEL